MTTKSDAEICRRAIAIVNAAHPQIGIKKITGGRIGKMRIAKVYFEDGRFRQIPFGRIGTHTQTLVDSLVKELEPSNAKVRGAP